MVGTLQYLHVSCPFLPSGSGALSLLKQALPPLPQWLEFEQVCFLNQTTTVAKMHYDRVAFCLFRYQVCWHALLAISCLITLQSIRSSPWHPHLNLLIVYSMMSLRLLSFVWACSLFSICSSKYLLKPWLPSSVTISPFPSCYWVAIPFCILNLYVSQIVASHAQPFCLSRFLQGSSTFYDDSACLYHRGPQTWSLHPVFQICFKCSTATGGVAHFLNLSFLYV